MQRARSSERGAPSCKGMGVGSAAAAAGLGLSVGPGGGSGGGGKAVSGASVGVDALQGARLHTLPMRARMQGRGF